MKKVVRKNRGRVLDVIVIVIVWEEVVDNVFFNSLSVISVQIVQMCVFTGVEKLNRNSKESEEGKF